MKTIGQQQVRRQGENIARMPEEFGCDSVTATRGFSGEVLGAAPVRQTQVDAMLERLHHCIDDIGDALTTMGGRISPVLSPDMTAKSASNVAEAPRPVQCPIATAIDIECDRLMSMTAELRDMLGRLEV